MRWSGDEHAGFSSVKPWQNLSEGWEDDNVEEQNDTISALAVMISARQEKVRLFILSYFHYQFVLLMRKFRGLY